jgi:hypothetical protein
MAKPEGLTEAKLASGRTFGLVDEVVVDYPPLAITAVCLSRPKSSMPFPAHT